MSASPGSTAWSTCGSCHSDPDFVPESAVVIREGRWLHGPIAVGECGTCHEAHSSRHPALLRVAEGEVDQLCLSCHDPRGPRTGGMAEMACHDCHEPHGGPDPAAMFLIGGRQQACTRCHELEPEAASWLHGPVALGDCGACHDAHGSEGSVEHVRRPIAPVCTSCHDPGLGKTESCNRTRECDVCHEAHAAAGPDRRFLREASAPPVWKRPAGSAAPPLQAD